MILIQIMNDINHLGLPYYLARPKEVEDINNAGGVDVSRFFPLEKNPECITRMNQFLGACQNPKFPRANHCHKDSTATRFFFKDAKVGPVYYTWDQVYDTTNNFIVFSGAVVNIKPYLESNTKPFGDEFDKLIKNAIGTDASMSFASMLEGPLYGHCLASAFTVGRLDATSSGCWTSQVIIWLSFVIIMCLIGIRFVLAICFRWGMSRKLGIIEKNCRQRIPKRRNTIADGKFAITMLDNEGNLIAKDDQTGSPYMPQYTIGRSLPRKASTRKSKSSYGNEVHTILLVTCYSEDRDSLKLTLDSLAATEYSEDAKMLVIIADGIIKGSGNDKSTPDLLLEMLELDENWEEPLPQSYLAVADGSKAHNMAKVYAGWYSFEGRSVATILIIKCGTPEETLKPGNRGKRDSQMILMRFLERITFNQRMCPLEYDMFQKIHYLMGVTPDFFEIVLMVDADTKVAPDSLARMVACMVDDPHVMGLCGETRIANKSDSWVSRIQVFEYYLSHHMTKAFESMFGLVTCLPGCFCMYRIKSKKSADTWTPILCSPEIINTYSQTVVDTLHKKNLLLLGEDRFLTTLMLRTFPQRKLIFVPRAYCKTTVPNTFAILLSQRRRWINSTIHNLMELVLVNELCGIFCCSMQFAIFLELVGTVTLPAAICFTM
jgi:chitin synthase